MSDTGPLNQAIADLKSEVGGIGTRMDQMFSDLNAAHASGDQAAIDTATASIREQVDALKAIAARDTPVA